MPQATDIDAMDELRVIEFVAPERDILRLINLRAVTGASNYNEMCRNALIFYAAVIEAGGNKARVMVQNKDAPPTLVPLVQDN